MKQSLPIRDEEPTLGLIRKLRDADVMDEALMQQALSAKRPGSPRRSDAPNAEPTWNDLQIITAQLATKPRFEDVPVDGALVLGLGKRSRLTLKSPIFVPRGGLDQAPLVALLVGEPGIQTLSPVAESDVAGASALCIDLDHVDAHRGLLRGSAAPVGVRLGSAHAASGLSALRELRPDFIVLDAGERAIATLARASRDLAELDESARPALIFGGELLLPHDFVKALALGADGVVVASSVIAAIDSLATPASTSSRLLGNFVGNSTTLLATMARACGHDRLAQFAPSDLTTWLYHVARASGVDYSGQAAD